jgi:hypothetical protein
MQPSTTPTAATIAARQRRTDPARRDSRPQLPFRRSQTPPPPNNLPPNDGPPNKRRAFPRDDRPARSMFRFITIHRGVMGPNESFRSMKIPIPRVVGRINPSRLPKFLGDLASIPPRPDFPPKVTFLCPKPPDFSFPPSVCRIRVSTTPTFAVPSESFRRCRSCEIVGSRRQKQPLIPPR